MSARTRRPVRLACLLGLAAGLVGIALGCNLSTSRADRPVPLPPGVEPNDLIDRDYKAEAENPLAAEELQEAEKQIRQYFAKEMKGKEPAEKDRKNILVLSGGGSLGAYTAGLLAGWTAAGTRPTFDVVTGISTGALIAPFAFLGPKYDADIQQFYTTSRNEDIFTKRYVRGLLGGESFTDTTPLRRKIDGLLTPEVMAELADAHRSGRRLYIGTTEEEGKRFIIWDLGMMACRNGPGDRELMIDVLIGSASIPGAFPASKIDVFVDGVCHTERHGDGGVSQALFFHPPYVPPEQRTPQTLNLVGTNVWVIVAGKLYADPEVIKPSALTQAGKAVSTIIYAQTRGDLQRLWTYSLLNGMNYHATAIPQEYVGAGSSGEFKPEVMTGLFEEGRRVICSGTAWRTTPPGTNAAQGELSQERWGRELTFHPRGPQLPITGPRGMVVPPRFPASDGSCTPAVPIQR
jgi:Patatin-like phospholipase